MSHPQRINLEPAYVLHRRPYRNSSLIIELLTRNYGRVGLIARGARKLRSRYHGVLSQFQPLLLSWSGRGELGTLNTVERCGVVKLLHRQKLISGFYINELLMRLLHRDDPCPEIYQSYEHVLGGLIRGSTPSGALTPEGICNNGEPVLRIFEKELLQSLGYGLTLEFDIETGQAIKPQYVYNYYLNKGPVAASGVMGNGELIDSNAMVDNSEQVAVGQSVVKLHGSSLIALAQGKLNDRESLKEVKYLTRMVLGKLLGSKPLNSRSLFKKVSARANPETTDSGSFATLE